MSLVVEANELQARRQWWVAHLEEVARRAAVVLYGAGAQQVILFGSVARGTARVGSDVDLAVVCDTRRPPMEETLALYRRLGPELAPIDLVVIPTSVLEQGPRSAFVRRIFEEGVRL